jgi:hypothetical protein
MSLEPTNEDRQRCAFDLLRDQARTAHLEGDGLQVAHLCETAFQEIDRLAKRKHLLIRLHQITWAFIFQVYWFIQGPILQLTRDRLKSVPCIDDNDRAWLTILETYTFFVEQPLLGTEKASRNLKALPIAKLGAEPTVESVELAIHLVELAWYHLVGSDAWEEVAELWTANGPRWLEPLLKPVKTRLKLQSRLTVPSQSRPPLPISAAADLRNTFDMAELWLLHLHGQRDAIISRIREISPRLSPDDYKWRLVADFWHTNPTLMSGTQTDTQGVWLARRRQMTTAYATLIFHDRRELEMRGLLADIHRRREEGSASHRWHVLQLAILHELAALRIWDFGMWREAARAQSETLLETAQWMQDEPSWSAQGFVTGVRSASLRSATKDALVQTAIDHIEFAPVDVLSNLSSDLFATYPWQKHTASELLDEIGDLVPESLWSEFAMWNVTYADESRRSMTIGAKVNPLKPWPNIFPLISGTSGVWQILLPEIVKLSRISHCWRSEGRAVLQSWLIWAPIDLSTRAAEAMMQAPASATDSFVRSAMIVSTQAVRPELGNALTDGLSTTAQSPEEHLVLARHRKAENVDELEIAVRKKTLASLRDAIAQAAPPDGATQFKLGLGGFIPGLGLIKHWHDEDVAILQDLADAVNSQRVLRDWIPILLNAIQLILANGSRGLAAAMKPFVTRWNTNLPLGQIIPGSVGGPLSIFQIKGTDKEDIAESVGWVSFQLLRKLQNDVDSEVRQLSQTILFRGYYKAMPIAFYSAVILATRTATNANMTLLAIAGAILEALRARMSASAPAADLLATAIGYLAGIAKKESELVNWNITSAKATLEWIDSVVASYAAVIARAPKPSLRAELASLLWNLSRWRCIPAEAAGILSLLKNDRRAQVRYSARGGFWD